MGEVIQVIVPGPPAVPEQVQQIIAPRPTVIEIVERGPVGPQGPEGPEGPEPSSVVTQAELDARVPVRITVGTVPPSSPTENELWVDLN